MGIITDRSVLVEGPVLAGITGPPRLFFFVGDFTLAATPLRVLAHMPIAPPVFFKGGASYFAIYIERLMKFYDEYLVWFKERAESTVSTVDWYAFVENIPSNPETGIPDPVTGRAVGFDPSTLLQIHPDAPAGTTDPEEFWVEGVSGSYFPDLRDATVFRRKIEPLKEENGVQISQLLKFQADINFSTYYQDLRDGKDRWFEERSSFGVRDAGGTVMDWLVSQGTVPRSIGMDKFIHWAFPVRGGQVPSFVGEAHRGLTPSGIASDYTIQGSLPSRTIWSMRFWDTQTDVALEDLRPSEYYWVWKDGDNKLFLFDMLRVKRDNSGKHALYNVLSLRKEDGSALPIRMVRPMVGGRPQRLVLTSSGSEFDAPQGNSIASRFRFMLVLSTDGKLYTVNAGGMATGRIRPILDANGGSPIPQDSIEGAVDVSMIGRNFVVTPGHWLEGTKTNLFQYPSPLFYNFFPPSPVGPTNKILDYGKVGLHYTTNIGSFTTDVYTGGGVKAVDIPPLPAGEGYFTVISQKSYQSLYLGNNISQEVGDTAGWGIGFDGAAREIYAVSLVGNDDITPEGRRVNDLDHFRLGGFANDLLPGGTLQGHPGVQNDWFIYPMEFQLIFRIPNLQKVDGSGLPSISGPVHTQLHKDIGLVDFYNSLLQLNKISEACYVAVEGKPYVTEDEDLALTSEASGLNSAALLLLQQADLLSGEAAEALRTQAAALQAEAESITDDVFVFGQVVPDTPLLDEFDVVFCGIGDHKYVSGNVRQILLSDPDASENEFEDLDKKNQGTITVDESKGIVRVNVLGPARGRIAVTVEDNFDIQLAVVDDDAGTTNPPSEDPEKPADPTVPDDPIFKTSKRSYQSTWRVFERTWPVNAGELAPPVEDSFEGAADPNALGFISGITTPITLDDGSQRLRLPDGLWDDRANLDVFGLGLKGRAPDSVVKVAGGAFLILGSSDDESVVRFRSDLETFLHSASGFAATPVGFGVTGGTDAAPEFSIYGPDITGQDRLSRSPDVIGQYSLLEDDSASGLVGSNFLRIECLKPGRSQLTIKDFNTDGGEMVFNMYVWMIKEPVSKVLVVGEPVTLEIDGFASLPITWTIETFTGFVSGSDFATITNDPNDPKKAILLPLKATVATGDERSGTLKVRATDSNKGWFKQVGFQVVESGGAVT